MTLQTYEPKVAPVKAGTLFQTFIVITLIEEAGLRRAPKMEGQGGFSSKLHCFLDAIIPENRKNKVYFQIVPPLNVPQLIPFLVQMLIILVGTRQKAIW